MRRAGITLLFVGAACAQTILNPARLPASFKSFEIPAGAQPLRCEPFPIKPSLNYGFRFQAGYLVRVKMDQYVGPHHTWLILERVTPEGDPSKAVYFGDRFRLPDVPKTTIELTVGGGYLLGEGRYRVEWKMVDEQGRICVREWTLDARRSHAERNLRIAMPAGSIADFSLRGVPATHITDDAAPIRLTVLLDAAPTSPRRIRLRGNDRVMLLGTLSSLLERVPTKSVRLIVFNLDQQKELFRSENFTLSDLEHIGRVINQTELGLVDYHVLQNPQGHVAFLAGLMNQEARAAEPSDVVLILGPPPRFTDKIPAQTLERTTGPSPRFLYLQYQPFLRATSTVPDTIGMAVKAMRGKTLIVRTPADFAKGIEQVEGK